MTWTIPMITLAVMIVLIAIPAIWATRMQKKEMAKHPGKYPRGHFIGRGMAIFLPLGVAFGILLGNIAIGLPIGVATGVAIGTAWEKEHEKKGEMRPLTKKEKHVKKVTTLITIITLGLGIIVFATIIHLTK